MITALDTNIIVALWDQDPGLNRAAQEALDSASSRGPLVMPAPVFAELLACPGRDETFVKHFCTDTGVEVLWDIPQEVWIAAGKAFQRYVSRRRAHCEIMARRILADFLIGACAAANADELLTMDEGLYRAAFPALALRRVEVRP